MVVRITEVCDVVVRRLESQDPRVHVGAEIQRSEVDRIVIETVRALGFDINPRTGEIYDPAREDNKISIANMPQRVYYAGMPSRSKRRR